MLTSGSSRLGSYQTYTLTTSSDGTMRLQMLCCIRGHVHHALVADKELVPACRLLPRSGSFLMSSYFVFGLAWVRRGIPDFASEANSLLDDSRIFARKFLGPQDKPYILDERFPTLYGVLWLSQVKPAIGPIRHIQSFRHGYCCL